MIWLASSLSGFPFSVVVRLDFYRIDDDVVLMKDREGRVIGFERLNFLSAEHGKRECAVPSNVT